MARSLMDQQTQIRGTTVFSSVQMEYAEQAGRSYYTGTLTAVSGSTQVTDDSTAFTREDVNNYIVIDSGAAAGVYLITDFSGNTATIENAISGDITGGSYSRHYFKNLEDDLNYIREQLKNVVGETTWYDIPDNDLYQLGIDLAAISGTLSSHDHDSLYSALGHTHVEADIIGLDKYTRAEVDTLISGSQGESNFIDLIDTPEFYTGDRLLFTSTSGVTWENELTYNSVTKTLGVTDISLSGSLDFGGDSVNELSTAISILSTDSQLPTAKAVWDAVDLVSVSGTAYYRYISDGSNTYSSDIGANTLYFYGSNGVSVVVDDNNSITFSGSGSAAISSVDLTYNSGSGYWYYDGNFTSVPDGMEVFLNGVKNKDNDLNYYSATVSDGELRIDFSFPTDATDWVNVTYGEVYIAQKWVTTSSGVSIASGQKVLLDSTDAAYTVVLPSTPVLGDEIEFLDAGYYCSVNNVTIDRNGNNIMGSAANLDVDTDGASFKLVYYNETRGWVMT